MNGFVKGLDVGEGLVSEVVSLEVVPDDFDVVEFRRVFRQPLDGQPMCPGGEGCAGKSANMDRAVVFDEHDRLGRLPGLGSVEKVELIEMSDEVAAALGRAGMNDELASDMVERAQHRDLLGLPRCRHTQVRAGPRPCVREIRMCQRLAFITIEKDDVASLGLTLAQLQTQSDPFDLACVLATFQRVPGPPPAELFFAVPWTVANG